MGNLHPFSPRSTLVSSLALALTLAGGCTSDSEVDTDATGTDTDDGTGTTAGTGDTGDCVLLTQADVDQDLTLPAGCYLAETWLTIESDLTLDAGVTISFGDFMGLSVFNGGTLIAKGSAAQPVILGPVDASEWIGVSMIGSSSSQNLLEYTQLTGVSGDAALALSGGSRLTVTNSTLADNSGAAFLVADDSELELSTSIIKDNAAIGVVGLSTLPLIASDNTFENNGEDVLEADGSSVAASATWRPVGVPVRLLSRNVSINADLVIEAGFELQVPQDGAIKVTSEGTLNAAGSEGDPVIIHGAQDELGYWVGLSFDSKSSKNVLDNVLIEHGGGEKWTGTPGSLAMIWLTENAKVLVKNSTLRRSAWYALAANRGSSVEGFANNQIRDNTRALNVSGDTAGQIASDNVFADNSDENMVRVGLGSETIVDAAGEWSPLAVPYLLSNILRINNDLTLAAGVDVLVSQEVEIRISSEGSLGAAGTANAPVVIAGLEPLSGYWAGINYGSTSTKNLLSYFTIRNAGAKEWYGGGDANASIYVGGFVGDALVTLESATIADADGYAMIVDQDSSISCSAVFDNVEKPSILGPGSC
jgi:hypothetical protein